MARICCDALNCPEGRIRSPSVSSLPVRQWVLALPTPLRLLLAAQPMPVTPVLQLMHRAITRILLDQAGLKSAQADSGSAPRAS